MLSLQQRRNLIRLANRDRFNSTEVTALLEYAEIMLKMRPDEPEDATTAIALIESWKDSFDEA